MNRRPAADVTTERRDPAESGFLKKTTPHPAVAILAVGSFLFDLSRYFS